MTSQAQSPEWMVVYITNNLPEAHIVAGRLQHEQIRAWVHSEPGAQAIGISIGSLGEVKVLVHPADYEKALAVLDDDLEPLPDSTDDIVYYDTDGSLINFEDDDDAAE